MSVTHIWSTCIIHTKETNAPPFFRILNLQEFIHSLGFMEFETWDESAWRPVVDVAMSCWQKGILCFSQAYCPSRTWRKRESSAARNPRPAIGQALVRSLFQEGKGGMFFFLGADLQLENRWCWLFLCCFSPVFHHLFPSLCCSIQILDSETHETIGFPVFF